MSQSESLDRSGVRDALEDVAQSGRQLLVNQFALVGAEAREGLDSAVNRLIEAFVAILLGFCGFVALTMAGIHQLQELVSKPIAYAIVGGSYMLAAFFLARMSAGKQPVTGKDN